MKFVAFDVETHGDRSRWISGSLVSDQGGLFSKDPREWLEALQDHARQGYTLVAHNAEFDVSVGLWPQGQDVALHFHDAQFTRGFWSLGRRARKAQVWDSANLYGHVPLALLGEAIGLPKLPMPRWLRDPEDLRQDWVCEPHGERGCLACYNLRDSEIVFAYVTQLHDFLAGYGIELRPTLAGNSVALWRYFDPGRQLTIRSLPVRKLGRAALHGGRTEVFKYGTVPRVWAYDRSSHYAAVMATCPMPDTRQLRYLEGWPRQLDLGGVEGVVEATIRQPQTYLPVLPVVAQGRVFYPVGEFRGAWPICELREALRRGARLVEVHRIAWAPAVLLPFTTTMGALAMLREDYRQRGDVREAIVKPLMNGLYGRLGLSDASERRIYRKRLPGQTAAELEGAEYGQAGETRFVIKAHKIPRPPETANVVWAACIAGWARVRLLEDLEAAGSSLCYCDTDGLVTLAPLQLGPPGFGRLREFGQYDEGTFLSPKHYRLVNRSGDSVLHAKGVPARVLEDYWRDGRASWEHPAGVIEALAKGIEPGRWLAVEHGRQLNLAHRHLTQPEVLLGAPGFSDSRPVVFSAAGPLPPSS